MLTAKVTTMAEDKPADKSTDKTDKIVEKRRALGRGLDTLLPGGLRPAAGPSVRPQGGSVSGPNAAPTAGPTAGSTAASTAGSGASDRKPGQEVVQLRLDAISTNPYQTRSSVDEAYLLQLSDSIATHGVLQPITVRPGPDGKYLLIAGECRWKASKLAEKETIPAIVRVVSDQQALELTIIENLQRADLNCMDQARAFQRLSEEFHLTQEEIAIRMGSTRSTISNYLRMMRLPEPVREKLKDGTLTFGHAKALMALGTDQMMVRMAIEAEVGKMSVRKLEDYVAHIMSPDRATKHEPVEPPRVDPNVLEAQKELERILGVRVTIRDLNGKGSITLQYRSLGDFDRVVEMLSGK